METRDDLILKLKSQGLSQSQIASLVQVSQGTVSNVLRKNNIKSYDNVNYGIVEQNKDRILELVELGYSQKRIAKEIGCAHGSIGKGLTKWGIKTKNKCTVDYDNLLKDKKEQVIKLHHEGKTQTEIAEIVGHSSPQICTLLKAEGLKAHMYHVNENFFDKVDSEEVAYVLGWFYSDGCVDNAGKMRIQIQKEDEAILYKIRELMSYDGPLYEVPPPKRFPNRKAQVCLCINRKSLADKLIGLGCTPNKSLTLTFPPASIVPETLLPHFVRGVFDGDGSVSVKKNKYCQVSITSTDIFLAPLRKYIKETLNIDTKHYYRYTHTNTVSMMITRTSSALLFLDWLYRESSYYLTRKYQIYQQCKQRGV